MVTNFWSARSVIIMWRLHADKREGSRDAKTADCGQDNKPLLCEVTKRLRLKIYGSGVFEIIGYLREKN